MTGQGKQSKGGDSNRSHQQSGNLQTKAMSQVSFEVNPGNPNNSGAVGIGLGSGIPMMQLSPANGLKWGS